MAKNVYCRKPLEKREAHIIKRLKKVASMPITAIAAILFADNQHELHLLSHPAPARNPSVLLGPF